MPLLDLHDIQGNVAAPYATTYARYAFVRFTEVRWARSWLRRLPLTTAAAGRSTPTVNIALSASGMDALGLPVEAACALPVAFRAGMSQRADILGDGGQSAPDTWTDRWDDVHAVLTVTGWSATDCRDRSHRLLHHDLVGVLHEQEAASLDETLHPFKSRPGSRTARFEHFGFRDGLSDPVIEGTSRHFTAGDGVRRDERWHPIKPGEFILGYEDQTRVVDLPQVVRPFLRNGSYMVWRKLRQDVAGFQTAYRTEVEQARVVGRWRDGTPLALHPDTDGNCPATATPSNDFGYAGDPQGRLCPVSAHIRRANPRDGMDFGDRAVDRHRLVRRGMPYADGEGKGLIFVCFVADIERQFEFVQQRWIIGDPARVEGAPDAIAAPSAATMRTYVRTMGGGYFFQPGLAGLRRLVGSARRR